MTRYAMTGFIEALLGVEISESRPNASLLCPLHHERNKSFSINLDEGLWICFSCGRKGNYETLCRELERPIDADYKIARAIRDASAKPVERRNFTALANHLHRDIGRQGRRAIDRFLHGRDISLEAFDRFYLGYDAERGAISFPYPDNDDAVRGIKYRYPDGFKLAESDSDFGLYWPKYGVGRDVVVICEGESDTLRTWTELGSSVGVIGTSGAGVSEAQWERFAVPLLFSRRVYLAYDADDAGDECAEKAMRVLGDKCIRIRPRLGKDITEHLAAGGTLGGIGYVG